MKKFWKSKSFWLNLLAIILQMSGQNPAEPTTSLVALGAANLGVRYFTNKGIVITGKEY